MAQNRNSPETSMIESGSPSTASAVACPFCGLTCDDLEVRTDLGEVAVTAKGCARSIALFRTLPGSHDQQPCIDGRPVDLAEAVARAAAILGQARQPLISGLATDVAGMRAAIDLADRTGAVLDHMNASALMRNFAVLQDSGWMPTSFSEVQNRADLVIVVGTDIVSRFPRFFERLLGQRESMFSSGVPRREIIYLGADAQKLTWQPDHVMNCANLSEAFAALRALLAGKALQAQSAGGVPMAELARLVQRMHEARYGVLTWAAADLVFPHADLTIQAMCQVVAELNLTTRFSVLPLGGSDGDITANQVTLWQTGFPLRTGFGAGTARHEPLHYATQRLLARGEADVLLWISAFDMERLPPAAPPATPTIVLGRSGMRFSAPPAVFIPVATPGIQHAGHFFRGDSVVAVRLRKLVESPLSSVAEVVSRISAQLGSPQL